jgi:hypothetical protein
MKKCVILFLGILTGGSITSITMSKINNQIIENKNKKANKFKSYYTLLNEWLYIRQKNRSLTEYFINNGYKKVGIYGLGDLGSRLVDEFKETEIEVVYGIDRDIDYISYDILVYSLDEIERISKEVDVIVVTAVFAYDDVKDMLYKKLGIKVISLEEVVFGIYNK